MCCLLLMGHTNVMESNESQISSWLEAFAALEQHETITAILTFPGVNIMSITMPINLGSVVSLWRYPVKSMMGEELNSTDVTELGLLGDRAYALVDSSDGKTATAKNPRKRPFEKGVRSRPRLRESVGCCRV
jgi:MOSC domain-containing protein